MKNKITIQKPIDCHVHLRNRNLLEYTVPPVAERYSAAIVMPNLKIPLYAYEQIVSYRDSICEVAPQKFIPLMTCYLMDTLTRAHIRQTAKHVTAFKYYPQGVTTNSDNGVTNQDSLYRLCEAIAGVDGVLSIHGEMNIHNGKEVDIFERESYFIDLILNPLRKKFPELRIVFEHISTAEGVKFVATSASTIVGTITAHHLWITRNDILRGGIQPHNYCFPIAQSEEDRQALIGAATSGESCFFLGSDSAPHPKYDKQASKGKGGCYTGHYSLELYTQIFDDANKLDNLEKFASINGRKFYNLPTTNETITLKKKKQEIPTSIHYDIGDKLIPFKAGDIIDWSIDDK